MPDAALDWISQRLSWPTSASRVLVACSGGADSLALLALAAHAEFEVVAAYIDHGLRQDTSADLRAVEDAARSLGVKVVSREVVVDSSANLEERARDARYAALDALAVANDCDAIVTGHTLDDQAETVLMAMLRGSGTRGLAGIPETRGVISRPMLKIRGHETREICRLLGWVPVEDHMNSDPAFTRVWLRREVIPELQRGVDRDIAVVLARSAQVARGESELLDQLGTELLAHCGVVSQAVSSRLVDPISTKELLAAPVAIVRRAIQLWLPTRVGSQGVEAILNVANGNATAADIGSNLRVRRSSNQLTVEPIALDDAASHSAVELHVPGFATYGDLEVSARIDRIAPVGWPDGKNTCVLDADVVGQELVVRRAEPTERFKPFGLAGTKTVVKARSDAGMIVDARNELPVVARANGEIVWVLGYRCADQARVTISTRRFCWISVERASEAVF